jgi:hypothetical protein
MRFTTTDQEGVQRGIVFQIKTLNGKNGVANMLWRAASQESAIAARRSVEKK